MDQDTSIGGLIRQIRLDLQRLITAQLTLLQAQLRDSGRAIGMTSLLFLGALGALSAAGLFLLVTLALGISALGLPVWAGFGIVTLLLILGTVALVLLGRRTARQIQPPTLLAGMAGGRGAHGGHEGAGAHGGIGDESTAGIPTEVDLPAAAADGPGDADAARA